MAKAPRTLLVVSAHADANARKAIADGRSPRKDFLELSAHLDADVVDYGCIEHSRRWRLVRSVFGIAPTMACIAFLRHRAYDSIFSDGEHVGIPLAMLLLLSRKPPRHVIIGHLLTTRSKRLIFRLLKPQRRIDVTLVHATNQRQQAATALGVSPDRMRLVPYQADTNFWRPQVRRDAEPLIATAGLEYRDYATLAEAVRGLPLQTVIAAGSHWSHHQHNLNGVALPDNIQIVSLDYPALRDLYARAAFVVVPLRPVENQAGVTTILEAMAMGKAVIVTATEGQRDVVRGRLCTAERFESVQGNPAVFGVDTATVRNETGIYVPPGDAAGLRRAIEYLLSAPQEAERLGAAGRALVSDCMNLERFVERVADALAAPAVKRAPAYV